MMAAQVEVQTGEVGRTVGGGRLHLSPLTDSSNKSLIEITSINQSHIIPPEPNKPGPIPKPRLTPKPFALERNPTIKPILAPKPQARPRPESTRLAGHNSELPSSEKPQQPVAPSKPRPVSTNLNRPASTFFKTSNKLNSGQTTKPIVQPFKPAPPLDPGDPSKPFPPITAERENVRERRKSSLSSLAYSKSLKQLPAAEWSGTTKNENAKDWTPSSEGGSSITRAKSMGFLIQVGQEEEEKAKPEKAVQMRPQPRGSRPRPVSVLFLDSPTETETPAPAPRWARRPLSADLTSKFESIGLSLHRKSPKANTKENTPEEKPLPQKREQEKPPKSPPPHSTDGVDQPAVLDQSNKKTEEMTAKETDEEKRAVSVKSRISLLLDSSSSPGPGATGQESDPLSPVLTVPETEPAVGVKRLIKQLTEDTTPTQSPAVKPPLIRPRPLPLDLTKRFSSEKSPDIGSVSPSEATEHHEISRDPQRRIEESAITPSDQKTFVDLKDSEEQLRKPSMPGPGGDVQTVRASLFEHVLERHSVFMVEEDKADDSLSSPSFHRGNAEDEGTLVNATYREPLSPSSPMRVLHAFDTVQAVEESRVVSENIPSALWENKAMTLRSRRSEGNRPGPESTAQGEPAVAEMQEQQPRYLRIGALNKWSATGLEQEASTEIGMPKTSHVALDQDRQEEAEQEEVAAAPKRMKTEEQPKPRATYFALTGQLQEPASPVDVHLGDITVPFDDFSVRSSPGSSQGKVNQMRRNPSLDAAMVNSQDQGDDLKTRSHMSHREIRTAYDGGMADDIMEVENKRELKKETERHMAKMKALERERQRRLEMEKEAHLEFARLKEREMQREFERQRQKAYEKEIRDFEEKQRQLERQHQLELQQKQKLQEVESARLGELEQERQRKHEKEKRRELERQRELDKERQLLEIQREKEKMEELGRIKEQETLQLLEEKMDREKTEKLKQMALEQEMLRMKELERERERQWEMERERQKEMEREKQREVEKERLRKQEMERRQLVELEKQKQAERVRQQIIEMEKRRLRERMEGTERDEAEKMRQTAKQQEAERQRLKERQKKEEQERGRLESSHLRPKVLDLDSVRRNDSFSKASPQRSDLATRWKEPSPRAEESYRSAILDIDSFTSPALVSPSKDLFPVSGIQGVDAAFGARSQPTPNVDVIWRGPPQTSGGITSPIWTTSAQDPWSCGLLRRLRTNLNPENTSARRSGSWPHRGSGLRGRRSCFTWPLSPGHRPGVEALQAWALQVCALQAGAPAALCRADLAAQTAPASKRPGGRLRPQEITRIAGVEQDAVSQCFSAISSFNQRCGGKSFQDEESQRTPRAGGQRLGESCASNSSTR
ncbi:hypothetical protein KUCAC02_028054 [Chaenocephalus aceratus]|uniref:Uncharacterized protein n=1 Tax=Chaenocephalus aceratus TaxID=36190 RepID=A0ACB9X0W2_CHAAC|nr:hypothetical protein KUCAC02_028054 [Chaenocephalus aceratus]